MAFQTKFLIHDFKNMLSQYNIGELIEFIPIAKGSVQTNYIIITRQGKFVLRYYESRSFQQVEFELLLLDKLSKEDFPCVHYIEPITNQLCAYQGKPYVIFEYIEGQHIENPNVEQVHHLIDLIAQLSLLTKSLKLKYSNQRISYTLKGFVKLANEYVKKENTNNAYKKYDWCIEQIKHIELPKTLTMGICHCDYYYTNILYDRNTIKALIDFDDANYTYLFFDIISIINFFKQGFNHETWQQYNADEYILDFHEAKMYLTIFEQTSPSPEEDKKHLYDILKLSILFDCLWYFNRGICDNFFEKRKIDALNKIGRQEFYRQLFE